MTSDIERDHLDQVLTYALAYHAPHAVIVQPLGYKSPHRGIRKLGTVQGITCHVYGIDLDADLDQEEAAFTDAVWNLVMQSTTP